MILKHFLPLYSPFQLTKKYLKYYFTAANGKGHGVHSPFVFEFIKNVLNDKSQYPCYLAIEEIRKSLLVENEVIEVEDFGAGSAVIKTRKVLLHGCKIMNFEEMTTDDGQ